MNGVGLVEFFSCLSCEDVFSSHNKAVTRAGWPPQQFAVDCCDPLAVPGAEPVGPKDSVEAGRFHGFPDLSLEVGLSVRPYVSSRTLACFFSVKILFQQITHGVRAWKPHTLLHARCTFEFEVTSPLVGTIVQLID